MDYKDIFASLGRAGGCFVGVLGIVIISVVLALIARGCTAHG